MDPQDDLRKELWAANCDKVQLQELNRNLRSANTALCELTQRLSRELSEMHTLVKAAAAVIS